MPAAELRVLSSCCQHDDTRVNRVLFAVVMFFELQLRLRILPVFRLQSPTWSVDAGLCDNHNALASLAQ